MSNLPTEVTQLGTGLAQAQQRISSGSSESPFIKLTKSGDWIFGADEIEVTDGLWAINPNSFIEGFIAWGEGELIGEEMAPMALTPIVLSSLPEPVGAKRGWEKQVGFMMVALSGEHEGQQVIYKASSKGGTKAVRDIVSKVVNQINAGENKIVPVVKLEKDSYKHKQYGKIFTPVLAVQEWSTMEGITLDTPIDDGDGDGDDDVPAEKPPAKKRRRIAS